jgi:hypothetical protein
MKNYKTQHKHSPILPSPPTTWPPLPTPSCMTHRYLRCLNINSPAYNAIQWQPPYRNRYRYCAAHALTCNWILRWKYAWIKFMVMILLLSFNSLMNVGFTQYAKHVIIGKYHNNSEYDMQMEHAYNRLRSTSEKVDGRSHWRINITVITVLGTPRTTRRITSKVCGTVKTSSGRGLITLN